MANVVMLTDQNGNQYNIKDAAGRSLVAAIYSTATDYAVGDYCLYGDNLYVFTTAHTAGAWNATHVEAVNIADEVADLKAAVADASGSVRYDKAQTLTDAQKAQAMSNIGVDSAVDGSAVKYNAEQSLTDAQKAQARENIGFADALNAAAVSYRTSQNLNIVQKGTALANIGAVGQDAFNNLGTRVTTAESDIDALETRAGNLERDAASLTGRVEAEEAATTSLATRMRTAEGDIDALEASAVRYTAQSLNDLQKAQARSNIAAAKISVVANTLVLEV